MIPVAQWFSRRSGQDPYTDQCIDVMAGDPVGLAVLPGEPDPVDPVAEAHERGRAEGLATAQAAADAALEAERVAWQARLDEAEKASRQQISAALTGEIRTAVATVLAQLEHAVAAALSPFLGERVRQEAAARLCQLAEQEIARLGHQLIEVRAPLDLHDVLREALAAHGLSTAIAEDDTVRIIGRDGTAVFESLAGRWLDLLESEAA